ncbi:hypothetical protein PHYPO_G00180250 [Pangasianodon hypophthalmus]|uniref:Mitochondrial antiviral-signaling protein n=1 Tax=Pangasianodon hypophthalmus TaxID=310915 RepID=A0A5N5PQ86_PANHP|nr:hypothetical protein PHYPO_G00180250 [Pangasianodon hypophthalmus]
MAYAGDRLYNEVIRRKMGDLASKVRAREIIAYLPCLTLSDREEIEAKRETAGNYCAIMVLLDNLRRRENWPDQFISALRTCEQWALADELSEAYDRIRGIHTQRTATTAASAPVLPAASVSPAAPPAPAPAPAAAAPSPAPSPAEASATVTTATIHNVPHSTPPLLTPSLEASAQSATPSPINSPPGPYPNIAAPALTEAPALVSAPDGPVHPPPESAHHAEPPLSVLAPDARPPSPVSAPTLTPSIGQSEVPVNSRETSKLDISGASAPINSPPESCCNIASPALTEDPALEVSVQPPRGPAHPDEPPLLVLAPNAMPPSPVSAPKVTPSVGKSEVPAGSRETPTLGISGVLTNTAPSGPSSVAAPALPTNLTSTSSQVNKPATTSQSSASPEKSKVPVVESSRSVKHPVQDTNPPGIVLAPDSQNNPTINQVVERVHPAVSPNCQTQETSQGTAQASSSASTDAVAGCLSNFTAENENFSKPGVLRGEEPYSVSSDQLQISNVTTEHSPIQPAVSNPHRAEEPVDGSVSVTTDDLMISSSTTTVPTQRVSDPIAPVPTLIPRAVENSFPEGDRNSYPHQPVEDHYESFCQSLQTEPGTRVHIVEVSEGPSIQNLNGQPPSMVGATAIGLSRNSESEGLVQSVSEHQPSLHIQVSSQCIKGNNASDLASPTAGLTTYAEPAPANFQESELNASGQINLPRSEQRDESQGALHQFLSKPHLIAAAAVGISAVFVAWRLKY